MTTRLGQFVVAVCQLVRPASFIFVMLVVSGMTSPVSGATPAGPWRNHQLMTFNQGDWGMSSARGAGPDTRVDLTTGSVLLRENVLNFFTSSVPFIEFGIPGTAGFSVIFSGPISLHVFLPQTGEAAALTFDIIDPSSTPAGSFGGEVVALWLNIQFTDAGLLAGTLPLRFGDLKLCKFGQDGQLAGLAQLNGLAVRQMLPIANTLLGGGTVGGGILELTIDDIAPVIAGLNGSFGAGLVSEFAQEHLCR